MFADFHKAFDSFYYDVIWSTLEKQGVPIGIINIINEIYSKSKAIIKTEYCEEKFEIRKGVKQGDPMSPNIFDAVLEEVFRGGRGSKLEGKTSN